MLLLTGIEPDYLETPDGDLADCATTDGKFEFKTQVPRPSSLVFPLFIFELNFMSPGTKFQNNFASTTDIFNRGHKNYQVIYIGTNFNAFPVVFDAVNTFRKAN